MSSVVPRRVADGSPRYDVRYRQSADGRQRVRTFKYRGWAERFAAQHERDTGPATFPAAPARAGEDWRMRAACRPTEANRVAVLEEFYGVPDLFFADDHGGALPAPARMLRLATRAALSMCAHCPVAAECLTEELRAEAARPTEPRWGVFGGTTARQRDRIAQGRRSR